MSFEIMLELLKSGFSLQSYKGIIFTSNCLQEDFFEEMLEEAVDEVDIEAKVMISLKIDYILLIILQFDQIVFNINLQYYAYQHFNQ